MKLKIDNREKDLIQIIETTINSKIEYKNKIPLEIKQLPLGDIIFTDDDDNDILIIERKSVNDLASSIKDGRYNEQSIRLSSNKLHNHNIIYLIEGKIQNVNSKYTKITPNILYSSLCSILYHKGFSILRSFDINETATIILRFFSKIHKEDKRPPYYDNFLKGGTPIKENVEEYVSSIKTIKKDNITPDNIGIIMLSQIPGISTITSQAIIEKYKSISEIIEALKNDKNCLNDITYTTKKGKIRRINKTSISSIKKFLI